MSAFDNELLLRTGGASVRPSGIGSQVTTDGFNERWNRGLQNIELFVQRAPDIRSLFAEHIEDPLPMPPVQRLQ